MISPRRMPTLGRIQGRRIPLAPRRRVILVRRRLAWAAGVSVALHAALLAAMIITFPNRTPQEVAAPPSVEMVFQPGAKTAATPAAKKGPIQRAQEAGPRGPKAPARVAQAARPAPPPAPPLPPPLPPPSKPVVPPPPPARPPPKPVAPKPVAPKPVAPKPAPPKPAPPKPAPPKPPAPPLPKINLPPPPPAAPPLPTPPVPVPTPAPPAPPVDDSQAEMNLDLPPMPELAPVPLPRAPPPLPAPPRRLARRSSRSGNGALGGGVVMNGLSFTGGGSSQGNGSARSTLLPQAPQIGHDSDFSSTNDIGTDWYAELRQWAEARVVYPEFAADLGQTGDVTVRFTVDRFGHVSNLRIVSASPYALLNEGWLSLWRGATVPSFPPGTKYDSTVMTYTVVFER